MAASSIPLSREVERLRIELDRFALLAQMVHTQVHTQKEDRRGPLAGRSESSQAHLRQGRVTRRVAGEPRHWLDYLRSHLPVSATFGLTAPHDTCRARNEGRPYGRRCSMPSTDASTRGPGKTCPTCAGWTRRSRSRRSPSSWRQSSCRSLRRGSPEPRTRPGLEVRHRQSADRAAEVGEACRRDRFRRLARRDMARDDGQEVARSSA